MGLFTFGPPRHVMVALARQFGLREFVETGTHMGETAAWASGFFDHVFTVENSEVLYRETSKRLAGMRNMTFLHGSSPDVLPEVLSALRGPAVFWLDAHWCGGVTAGADRECPLLEEIEMLNATNEDHFLFIDDARLFTTAPPEEHSVEAWPSFPSVLDALRAGRGKRYTIVQDDVIVSVPGFASTQLWEAYANEPSRARDTLEQTVLGAVRGASKPARRLVRAIRAKRSRPVNG